jgi:hypothetical protein
MKTTTLQKGSGNTAVIAIVILMLFMIGGAFVFRTYNTSTSVTATSTSQSLTDYIVDQTTGTTTNTYAQTPTPQTIVRTTLVSPFPGGSVYRNSTYGLSVPLPASWNGYTTTEGRETFAGVTNLASIRFYLGGANPLTINVFTKEQWNDIRIQETNLQVNGYGEGSYLGENGTYIFATNSTGGAEIQSILDAIRFF